VAAAAAAGEGCKAEARGLDVFIEVAPPWANVISGRMTVMVVPII